MLSTKLLHFDVALRRRDLKGFPRRSCNEIVGRTGSCRRNFCCKQAGLGIDGGAEGDSEAEGEVETAKIEIDSK